jgi:hypothetical protein
MRRYENAMRAERGEEALPAWVAMQWLRARLAWGAVRAGVQAWETPLIMLLAALLAAVVYLRIAAAEGGRAAARGRLRLLARLAAGLLR